MELPFLVNVNADASFPDPLLDALRSDLLLCQEAIANDDSQFQRRNYIRCVFAFFEGFSFQLRSAITTALESESENENFAILHALAAFDDPDDTGKLRPRRGHPRFLNNFALTLRAAAAVYRVDPASLFSGQGWPNFRLATDTRHDITHPNDVDRFTITDAQLTQVSLSLKWLFGSLFHIATTAEPPPAT